MGWPKGVPRKTREIVEQDNRPIENPVAPESQQFTEKADDGGLIQNAPHHQAFNARQRENMEAKYEQEVLGVKKEEEPPIQTSPVEQAKEEVKEEEQAPLRPTVVVKEQQEEPVTPVVAKPQETPPVSTTPSTQVTESEEYKSAVKRMHEATREAAETRKQLKQALDMMAQLKSSPGEQRPPERQPEPQQLTPEQKLEMLQSDPVGYMDRLEREAIEKAERAVFNKLEKVSKEGVQKQQIERFVSALDNRFREKYTDLGDPLFAPYIEKASQSFALTQEGAVTLVTDPEKFIDTVAERVRPVVENLRTRFTPGEVKPPLAPIQEQSVSQDKRERIPASPIVKPSSSLVKPAGPTEEAGQTPQEYADSRRLQQKRVFGHVTV
jgi:hypothetical protein